jgi:hypothetical protein
MTSAQSPSGLPLAAAAATEATEADVDAARNSDSGPTVGAADAEADAARSGADTDLTTGTTARDSDGVPVGSADAEADARASGADE